MTPPRATASTTACEVQLAGVPLPTTRSGSEVSTARAAGGIGELPVGLPATAGGGTIGVRPSARWRNAAIWPRVTSPSGQNRPFPQPDVISAVASRLIAVAKRWLGRYVAEAHPTRRGEVEAAGDEGGHLAAGDEAVGAEPAAATAIRDAGGRQAVDRDREAVAGWHVAEAHAARRGQVEGPGQEGRHLAAGDEAIGAEEVVRRRVAAVGDPLGRDRLDRTLELRAVVVEERATGWQGGAHGRHRRDEDRKGGEEGCVRSKTFRHQSRSTVPSLKNLDNRVIRTGRSRTGPDLRRRWPRPRRGRSRSSGRRAGLA